MCICVCLCVCVFVFVCSLGNSRSFAQSIFISLAICFIYFAKDLCFWVMALVFDAAVVVLFLLFSSFLFSLFIFLALARIFSFSVLLFLSHSPV